MYNICMQICIGTCVNHRKVFNFWLLWILVFTSTNNIDTSQSMTGFRSSIRATYVRIGREAGNRRYSNPLPPDPKYCALTYAQWNDCRIQPCFVLNLIFWSSMYIRFELNKHNHLNNVRSCRVHTLCVYNRFYVFTKNSLRKDKECSNRTLTYNILLVYFQTH